MIKRIIRFSLNNRSLVLILLLCICISGVYKAYNLPIDAVPDITNIQVIINTKTGALLPEQIETLVTYPIEIEMTGLPNLQEIRSLSKFGLSQVTLIFHDSTDRYFSRQLVNERLQSLRSILPSGVSPELGPVSTGLGEVFMYNLKVKDGSTLASKPEKERLMILRQTQDRIVRPILKRIKGVADVDTNGGYNREIHVNFNPEKLESLNVTINELTKALNAIGQTIPGGYIEHNSEQIIIQAGNIPGSLSEIENLPVILNFNGQTIRIKDVAEVRIDHSQRIGSATEDGEETVLGTVLMMVGANSRTVAADSEEAIKSIKLPPDIEIKELYSRRHLVEQTVHTISKNLLEGAFFVVAVLILLLGSFKASLMVALAIPISMLIAVQGLSYFGISANLMSLGAIDFGLIVDASVVLVENIVKKLEEAKGLNLSRKEKFKLIQVAVQEISSPLLFGLAIIILVYIPILGLEGTEGKMFHPMAITVILALIASLVVAIVIMPVLSYIFLNPPKNHHKDPILFKLIRASYSPILKLVLSHKWIALPIVTIPLLIGGYALSNLGSDFMPQLDEGDMVIGLIRDSKESLSDSIIQQKNVEKLIKSFPEVDNVFSRMGTPESATDPMSVNFADTFIILKKDFGEKIDKENLYARISDTLSSQLPEQDISLTQPIEMRFNELLEGSRADITLRIIGPDLNKLMDLARVAESSLASIQGVESIESDPLTALTKSNVLKVIPRTENLMKYSLTLNDLGEIFKASLMGIEVGSYKDEGYRLPIILHLGEEFRDNIDTLKHLKVSYDQKASIPLSTLADINHAEEVTTIARVWSQRYSAISVNLKGRDVKSFVEEAMDKIEREIVLPKGYSFYWGGQFKNLERASARLRIIVPLTLLIIFILLVKSFRSLLQAFLVFLSIPFATVGGVLFLYFRGIPLSVPAGIGFIALSGIAILNGMVMMNCFNDLKNKNLDLNFIAEQGALLRLRPVCMTALVASLGFIPMAFFPGVGSEVQRPLATVVIGGLITSTILTLIVLPVLFDLSERLKIKKGP